MDNYLQRQTGDTTEGILAYFLAFLTEHGNGCTKIQFKPHQFGGLIMFPMTKIVRKEARLYIGPCAVLVHQINSVNASLRNTMSRDG